MVFSGRIVLFWIEICNILNVCRINDRKVYLPHVAKTVVTQKQQSVEKSLCSLLLCRVSSIFYWEDCLLRFWIPEPVITQSINGKNSTSFNLYRHILYLNVHNIQINTSICHDRIFPGFKCNLKAVVKYFYPRKIMHCSSHDVVS